MESWRPALLFALLTLRKLKRYVRTFVRNIAAIIPLAAVAFLFLAAGTWAARGILAIREFPALWTYAPLEFLGLKISAALFLAAALYNPFRRFPVPRNGSFYSAAALFFLLVEIVVVAVFDITFTSYFLWAFVCVFLSTLARNRWAKALLAIPRAALGHPGNRERLPGAGASLLPDHHPLADPRQPPRRGGVPSLHPRAPAPRAHLPGAGPPAPGDARASWPPVSCSSPRVCSPSTSSPSLPSRCAPPAGDAATQTIVVDAAGSTSSTTLQIDSPAPVRGISLVTPGGSRDTLRGWNGSPVPLDRVGFADDGDLGVRQFLQQRTLTLDVQMPSRPRSFSVGNRVFRRFRAVRQFLPRRAHRAPAPIACSSGPFPRNPCPSQFPSPSGGSSP